MNQDVGINSFNGVKPYEASKNTRTGTMEFTLPARFSLNKQIQIQRRTTVYYNNIITCMSINTYISYNAMNSGDIAGMDKNDN